MPHYLHFLFCRLGYYLSLMIHTSSKNSCNICDNPIKKISFSNKIDSNTSHSWESDSAFESLNLSDVNCFIGFCTKCFQSTIYPKFNADLLYTDTGVQLRKKYYEKYNKEKIYGVDSRNNTNLFNLISNDLNRFKVVSKMISETIRIGDIETFSILDYGGGDGYISHLFSLIIKTLSKAKVNVQVYDLHEWQDSKIEKLDQKKFDLIILSHVIEHTHSPRKMVDKVSNHLNSNGIIYCEVPDERSGILKILFNRCGLNFHVTRHTRRSISKLFQKSGFQNIKTKYTYHSSYRGTKTTAIVAIASKTEKFKKNKNREPYRIYEFLSFFYRIFIYFLHKIRK